MGHLVKYVITYGLVHIKDMFVITQDYEICTQYVMDKYLAIVYQLSDLACYSYWYIIMVLGVYSVLRWLVHDYYT